MKVLLINNCHYRRGGADVVYLNTGALLSNHGHHVSYFSTKSAKNEPTEFSDYFIDDIDALNLNIAKQLLAAPRKLYSLKAKRNLGRLIESTQPDICHIHLYKGGLTASILTVLKKYKIPTIITLHDFSLLCPRNLFLDGNDNICEKCLTSHTINCVIYRCNRKKLFFSIVSYIEYELNNKIFRPEVYFDSIISVCRFNFDKHQFKPELRKKLVQIYNFYPQMSITKPHHIKGDYYFFYGRLSKEKGIITLIDAWAKLDVRYKLKIAGEGSLKAEICKKLRIENIHNIELLGFKSGDELKELIKNASFIIVPSECNENNPMTIVEGYSLGKPVIGSNVGGIPEIVNEGKTGFLFEMKNISELVRKIEQADALSDKDYEIFSKNSWQFAKENFSEETHYSKLISAYTDTISKKVSHGE
jgi:glycosyltransferase involved in cell wall biosynthesis